jgi:hypothetical protein
LAFPRISILHAISDFVQALAHARAVSSLIVAVARAAVARTAVARTAIPRTAPTVASVLGLSDWADS